MREFFQEMQSVASEVLSAFDMEDIFYVRVTPGNGPPDDPGAPVETDFKVDGAARGVKFRYIDGTVIVAGDLQATMAVHSDVTPDMTGFVKLGTVPYKIAQIDQIPPVGVPVAYRLFFRK